MVSLKDKRGSLLDPIISSAYILKIVITVLLMLTIWVGFSLFIFF